MLFNISLPYILAFSYLVLLFLFLILVVTPFKQYILTHLLSLVLIIQGTRELVCFNIQTCWNFSCS